MDGEFDESSGPLKGRYTRASLLRLPVRPFDSGITRYAQCEPLRTYRGGGEGAFHAMFLSLLLDFENKQGYRFVKHKIDTPGVARVVGNFLKK